MIGNKCRFSAVFVIALKIKFFLHIKYPRWCTTQKCIDVFSHTHHTLFDRLQCGNLSLPRVYVNIRPSHKNVQAYSCIILRKCVQWESNCSMQTNRRIDMTNLIVVFLNFANASKKRPLYPLTVIHKIYYFKGLISYENSTCGCAPREGLYQLMVFTVFLSHSMEYYMT